MSGEQVPSVGRIVHYRPRRSADGRSAECCHAAVVTAADTADDPIEFVSLAVLNPTGLFFETTVIKADEILPGTWHWPGRDGRCEPPDCPDCADAEPGMGCASCGKPVPS